MKGAIIITLIIAGILWVIWKHNEPTHLSMAYEPAAFLFKCYEDEDKKVKNYSMNEFKENYYNLQSSDWCYQEYLERMKSLKLQIEQAKLENSMNDPYTKQLMKWYYEGQTAGPAIRDSWYDNGWRKTLKH